MSNANDPATHRQPGPGLTRLTRVRASIEFPDFVASPCRLSTAFLELLLPLLLIRLPYTLRLCLLGLY